MLSKRKLTESVSGSVWFHRVICTEAAVMAENPKTGSPAGGLTTSELTVGDSFGAENSKIARSMFFRSAGAKASGDLAATETPGIDSRPRASSGEGLTNRMFTDFTEPAVAYATLSSAKPSPGDNSAL